MAVCTNCHLWPLHDDNGDVYCSWCRHKLVGYAVSLDREVLVLRGAHHTVWLTVTNLGQKQLDVDNISASEPWLDIPDVQGHSLQPDGPPLTMELGLQQALLELERTYTATIEVKMRDGSPPESVTLRIVPAPHIRVEMDNYEVVLDDTASTPHGGRVVLDKGAVHLTALEVSEPWLAVVEEQPGPWFMGGPPGSELRFALRVNAALLRERLVQLSTTATEFPVHLQVHGQELEQPVETTFTVTCYVPPQLRLQGLRGNTLHLRGFVRRCHEVKVTIENRGGRPLLINQMILDPVVPWIQMAPSQPFPHSLEPGHVGTGLLLVDGTSLDAGIYRASFTLMSNSYPTASLEIPVVVHLDEMPVYSGIVAFDFGTTNSCAVVWDTDGTAPRIVPLDPDPSVPVNAPLPSVILYEQLLEDEHKVYQIGTYAKSMAPLLPDSTIQSIKRSIGRREPVRVVFERDGQRRSYLPEKIAEDIIIRMIRQVESDLGQKIETCVITHPSTFAPSQLDALHRTFTACEVCVDMMLHEPVAAALDYILSPAEAHPASPYTLLVYDFGGGTIDITLLSVEDVTDLQGYREITPKVLGASGRQRFGGDDVTTRTVRELCRQFNEWLTRNRTAYQLETEPDKIATIDDPEEQQRARSNYAKILQFAEETKIRASNDSDPDPLYQLTSPLLDIVQDNPGLSMRPLAEFSRQMLNDRIQDDIKSTLAIIDTMLRNAEVERPHVILLAGQSSRLPIVKELFTKRFPVESILWAGQRYGVGSSVDEFAGLKECVARGACQAAWFLTLPGGVVLNPTHMQPIATARIGLAASNSDGQPAFHTVISTGEPVGTRKSIGSLRLTRQSRIRVLENTGSSDDLKSPDIEELGTYNLARLLPPEITNDAMRQAQLEMELNERHEVVLHLQVPNREPLQFICERWVKEQR